jgi:cytoskeletal protein RodZ
MNEQGELPVTPIGERLKRAREAKNLTLDDVAGQTRVPIRHLQHIESGEWDSLPAPTYSVGFVRSYANAVGLNGAALGQELREQLGGAARPTAAAPYYEPADPARVPPRSLAIVAAVIAVLLIGGYLIWRSGAVDDTDVDAAVPIEENVSVEAPQGQRAAPAPAPAATGPVVLTATEEVWFRVYERGGTRLTERLMQPGERYEVPATATAPLLLTGRPNALRVTVGSTEIPALGPAEQTVSDVSLKAEDLVARLGSPGAGAAGGTAPRAAPAGR